MLILAVLILGLANCDAMVPNFKAAGDINPNRLDDGVFFKNIREYDCEKSRFDINDATCHNAITLDNKLKSNCLYPTQVGNETDTIKFQGSSEPLVIDLSDHPVELGIICMYTSSVYDVEITAVSGFYGEEDVMHKAQFYSSTMPLLYFGCANFNGKITHEIRMLFNSSKDEYFVLNIFGQACEPLCETASATYRNWPLTTGKCAGINVDFESDQTHITHDHHNTKEMLFPVSTGRVNYLNYKLTDGKDLYIDVSNHNMKVGLVCLETCLVHDVIISAVKNGVIYAQKKVQMQQTDTLWFKGCADFHKGCSVDTLQFTFNKSMAWHYAKDIWATGCGED